MPADIDKAATGFIARNLPALAIGVFAGLIAGGILGFIVGKLVP